MNISITIEMHLIAISKGYSGASCALNENRSIENLCQCSLCFSKIHESFESANSYKKCRYLLFIREQRQSAYIFMKCSFKYLFHNGLSAVWMRQAHITLSWAEICS